MWTQRAERRAASLARLSRLPELSQRLSLWLLNKRLLRLLGLPHRPRYSALISLCTVATQARCLAPASHTTSGMPLDAVSCSTAPRQVGALQRMCRAEDRIGSGAVPRLFVQKALRGACRGLIHDLGGATVLDLLEVR